MREASLATGRGRVARGRGGCRRAHAGDVRRGLTLIELVIALAITVLITAGIAGMVSAVNVGVVTRQDTRDVMVRAAIAQGRLDSYVAPARCVLKRDPTRLVLWLHDDRPGGTVHLSEVRWISRVQPFDHVKVERFAPTQSYTETQMLLQDKEYANPATVDWWALVELLRDQGKIGMATLVDGATGLEVFDDASGSTAARRITLRISLETSTGSTALVPITSTILFPRPPS